MYQHIVWRGRVLSSLLAIREVGLELVNMVGRMNALGRYLDDVPSAHWTKLCLQKPLPQAGFVKQMLAGGYPLQCLPLLKLFQAYGAVPLLCTFLLELNGLKMSHVCLSNLLLIRPCLVLKSSSSEPTSF